MSYLIFLFTLLFGLANSTNFFFSGNISCNRLVWEYNIEVWELDTFQDDLVSAFGEKVFGSSSVNYRLPEGKQFWDGYGDVHYELKYLIKYRCWEEKTLREISFDGGVVYLYTKNYNHQLTIDLNKEDIKVQNICYHEFC